MTKRQSEIVQFALGFLTSNVEDLVADMVDQYYPDDRHSMDTLTEEEIIATQDAFLELL